VWVQNHGGAVLNPDRQFSTPLPAAYQHACPLASCLLIYLETATRPRTIHTFWPDVAGVEHIRAICSKGKEQPCSSKFFNREEALDGAMGRIE
jgi:hypothetical protein